MALPLAAMLETGRLGTHNALADADGLVRRYPIYMDAEGWRIPSLPATLVKHLGYAIPAGSEIILSRIALGSLAACADTPCLRCSARQRGLANH
jgi:adenylate cyclase